MSGSAVGNDLPELDGSGCPALCPDDGSVGDALQSSVHTLPDSVARAYCGGSGRVLAVAPSGQWGGGALAASSQLPQVRYKPIRSRVCFRQRQPGPAASSAPMVSFMLDPDAALGIPRAVESRLTSLLAAYVVFVLGRRGTRTWHAACLAPRLPSVSRGWAWQMLFRSRGIPDRFLVVHVQQTRVALASLCTVLLLACTLPLCRFMDSL
jgi:hypothetical protein